MSFQHARKPDLLSDSDYGEFTLAVEEFLSDDRSLPNRPTHLVAGQIAAGLAFRTGRMGVRIHASQRHERKGHAERGENSDIK